MKSTNPFPGRFYLAPDRKARSDSGPGPIKRQPSARQLQTAKLRLEDHSLPGEKCNVVLWQLLLHSLTRRRNNKCWTFVPGFCGRCRGIV